MRQAMRLLEFVNIYNGMETKELLLQLKLQLNLEIAT